MWAIEYLYQTLQCFAGQVQDSNQRKEIRETFLNQDVPRTLERLLHHRNAQEEQSPFEQALQADEEFRFTVNYYLREDQYDDEPYINFKQSTLDFFKKKIGEDNA